MFNNISAYGTSKNKTLHCFMAKITSHFKPYVPTLSKLPELTLRAVFLGIALGLIFGIGNAYLGLKVGTTVSASIPAAVLSMAFLRIFSKNVSI